jgi:hypothetical protein
VDEGAGDMYAEVSVLLIRLQDLVVLPSICVSVGTVTAPLLCLFLSSERVYSGFFWGAFSFFSMGLCCYFWAVAETGFCIFFLSLLSFCYISFF